MEKSLKRILSTVLSTVMVISSFIIADVGSVTVSAAEITAQSVGWHETAYTEWLPVEGADSYEAYVKKTSDSEYTKLDDELVREYDTFVRADALGLAAGTYNMKIVALDSSGSEIDSWESGAITVDNYSRDGFAFADGGSSSGAYNDDGTLKDGAVVIYVTDENKDTIEMDIITSNKGATTTCTGLGEIIKALEKGYETTPLDFRFIGQVSCPDSTQSLNQLDVKRSEAPITFEGVGNDAFALFGFNLVEANNVEIRNLGFKDMTTKDEDGVTIKDESQRIWVHNCDFFYGGQGSDSDQAKGDGSVDLKGTSTYITVSDNHYWDSGKVNLCGLGESADYYVTYSRNWFDHSDSRHPRVRTGSVHVYNNYYDGVSKYGVGATSASSVFVDSNYFRNTNYPVLISKQGTDGNGSGTFSGEDGGIIKMYGNIMVGSKYTYIEGTIVADDGTKTYDNWADGYSVDSRDEQLPSSLVTYSGGTSYNNFDTSMDLGLSNSSVGILEAKDVPGYVMNNAGRINGGNFRFDFNDETDDTDYDVMPEMTSALAGYTYKANTEYVSSMSTTGIDGNTFFSDRTDSYNAEAAALPEETDPSGNTAQGGGSTSSADLVLNSDDVSTGTYTSAVTGLGTNGAFTIYATSGKSVTVSSSKGIQLGGAGTLDLEDVSNMSRVISVDVENTGTIYVTSASNGSDMRTLNIADSDGNVIGTIDTGSSAGVYLNEAGTYYIYSAGSGINVTKVSVVYSDPVEPDDPGEDDDESSTDTTESESSTEESSESSTETTEGSSESTTEESSESTTETTEGSSESTTEDEPEQGGTSDIVYGDVDGNGILEINDVSMLIDMVLKGNAEVIDGITDVTSDGKVDTADIATILQKILDSSWNMPCEPDEEDTTEMTTADTTETSTETTTTTSGGDSSEENTEATTEESEEDPTEEVTEEITEESEEDPTEEVTEEITETSTEATTEETTEATTEESSEDTTEIVAEYTFYDFNDNPVVTKDGTEGIIYTVITKEDEVSDGLTAEAVIVENNGSFALYLNDVSLTDTVKATLPLTEKSSGVVTYTAKITPSASAGSWTIMQLNGTKADGTEGEVLGLRTNSSKEYGLRINGTGDSESSGVVSVAGSEATVTITVDFDNDTASLSVDGSTPVTVTGVDAQSITSMSFQTATGARSLYVDDAGITVNGETSTEETTEGTTSEPADESSYVHNFTTDGTSSVFFTISGNLSSSKGTVEYNGLTLTQCLKLETSTSITFTAQSDGTLTLVFNPDNGNKNCKIDGEKQEADENGVLTVSLTAGDHEITKADVSNLFYMVFTPTA